MFSRSARGASRYLPEHDEDWQEPEKKSRDWKKIFLVFGLGALSWVATYVGMLELIQSNMGALDIGTKAVIGFSVAMLMTMIIWLLDQMFAPHPFVVKFAYVTGYVFLTIISVGFGFGFYWKVLESRSEASRSAESAVSQVQASLLAGSARLDQLQGTLEQLTLISQEKAVQEREKGSSCPNSRPGDGPRRRLRDDDAGRFSFASNFVKGRSTQVKADMKSLDGDLKKITSSDASTFDKATGTRNKFLQELSRKLELTATGFNAFRTDPQLRQIRSELAERANRSTFPTGSGSATFSCPDGQLQSALLGVVKAIDQLPELGKPEIATVEGAQAVVEAFRRLTTTMQGVLVLKLPPSADELRALQTQAVRSVTPGNGGRAAQSASGLSQGGLSQRDYIPLAIAAFVDLCLLLVSIGRPMNRLGGLVPKMREAERGPVYQILSKFDDIHRDPKVREKFEVFRHVVFDFNGDYYVAVPLDAPRNRNPDEVKNLQLEAHLLGNLFASFEKEKIFSRVYNPLLSRKTIQKKLWRQGSKFAGSQAFRTYRFRDGAWSDIILGAVMGAARRAQSNRLRNAEEAGPQLDLPQATGAAEASDADLDARAEARARRIIAELLDEQTAAVKAHLADDPFVVESGDTNYKSRGQRRPAGQAPLMREDVAAAFGPYAERINAAEVPDDQPSANQTAWPYRRPPTPPGEADVDLLPANSNTSPRNPGAAHPGFSHAADNVILMPLPANQTPSDMSAAESRPETEARAAVQIADEAPVTMGPPPLPGHKAVAERAVGPAGHAHRDIETSMNVRITQRTADFQIPIRATSGGQSIEFIRAGLRSAQALDAEDAEPQDGRQPMVLDVVDGAAGAAVQRSQEHNVIMIETEDAPELIVEAEVDAFEARTPDQARAGGGGYGNDRARALSEDDLEEISRRFAPMRQGD